MITLNCDKCEKPFQVEDASEGERVACPYCGDINRVTDSHEDPKPQAVEKDSQEKEIAVVRTAMFRAHPFWYVLMVLFGIGGAALAIMAPMKVNLDNRLAWVGLGAFGISAVWWLIWWAAPHRWVKLTITTKRSIRQEGIIMRNTSEVLHKHICNVKIEQSFVQRLLRVGTISIDAAGGAENDLIEIEMHYVPKPYDVKAIIDRYRKM